MVDDPGQETPKDQGSEEKQKEFRIDKDPQTQALESLFTYAFFDDAGKSFLQDEQGNPVINPTIVSIGVGGSAAHEQAAARRVFSKSIRYVGIEPQSNPARLSQVMQDHHGEPDQLDLVQTSAEQFLTSLANGSGELYAGMPINVLLARNLLGAGDPLSSEKGMDTMVALAEHITPGGLIGITFPISKERHCHRVGQKEYKLLDFKSVLQNLE
ncbi:MAG TPA: hypothetical protein VEW42_00635 [Candidatus Eisenbacteria bacterium]|nr:hypothetical protein [Candidatus Eisenbacteria bacterium]